jgi:hypothetical protein
MTRPSIALSDLAFHVLGRGAARRSTMRHAYELWRDGWTATLREVAGIERLYSDEFTRQDEIVAVFRAGVCIAVGGLRWADLSLPAAREDSYFGRWPEPVLVRLERSLVCITSNTLVAPEWRGARIELEGSPPMTLQVAMIALPIQRWLDSPARFVVGVARNDRAMNRTARGLGMSRYATIRVHGIESDIMVGERSTAAPPGPVVETLWNRRIVEDGPP